MILIAFGTIFTIASIIWGALVFAGNAMSDMPSYGVNMYDYKFMWIGLALAGLCFVGHHYGW